MVENMQVMILCGGKGTRIRDVSEILPKPMLPIGGRPVLWHIMKLYAQFGLSNFVCCLGYKGSVVKEFFLNYREFTEDIEISLKGHECEPQTRYLEPCREDGWSVILAETGEDSQTGARVKRGSKYINGATFMLTYGDGVGDVNIGELLKFHKAHGKLATITGVRPPGRFGELGVEGDTVVEFNEKPQVSSGYINGGFFVLEKEFVDRYMNDRADLVLEWEPLRECARDGELKVFEHNGFWQPMDTMREYHLLNDLWVAGEAPWKVWG